KSHVTVVEHALATRVLLDKGGACGVEYLDGSGALTQVEARSVILATGGAGNLYLYTTNPSVATGDGVALAFESGAEVADMEFYQFHPTALRLPGAPAFLISEAVRGEGGVLRNVHGRRFMERFHPMAELAPRDVVSRAIAQEMERTQQDHVLLDVTHLPASRTASRFPSIYRFCLEHGLDITTTPIPVAPAAHYMMGGVKTNTWGETNVPRLYACGEAASCGVHGANRLASNSLLETLVFGRRVVQRILGNADSSTRHSSNLPEMHTTMPLRSGEPLTTPPPSLADLQRLMWSNVGIVREEKSLVEAAETLARWQHALPSTNDTPSRELSSLVLVGRLIAEAALLRTESRGAHYRSDYPDSKQEWERHIGFTRSE
ncbi:MAG: FAD-binding protein, partial [Chloroflexota bacterium]